MKMMRTISALCALSLGASVLTVSAEEKEAAAKAASVTSAEYIGDENVSKEELTFNEYNGIDDEMYNVVGRNRIAAHTNSVIPYDDEAAAVNGALNYAKETGRVQMLTGETAQNSWDITVVQNMTAAEEAGLAYGTENPFAAEEFAETEIWKQDVAMPMSWTMQGDFTKNTFNSDGTIDHWEWDHPVYTNSKMPWQGTERPGYNGNHGGYGSLSVGEAPTGYAPVGFYRTKFTVDEKLGERVRISFQGVESAYYVFINGEAVGYSEDSYTAHEFDITDYLHEGENTLAVRVHKFSDATWLEDQDMIYDGGIFRDVYLIGVPDVEIADYKVETDLDESYTDADMIIKELTLKNNTDEEIPAGYTVTANLYDDEDTENVAASISFTTGEAIPANGKCVFDTGSVTVTEPSLWSAEKPDLYVLSFSTQDTYTAQLLGFREIEFTPTTLDENHLNNVESYKRITINGQPLFIKGVNRHESDPVYGKTVPKEVYEEDIKLMKQYNINSIRTAHYPSDEYMYYLADKYGIYIMAEVNAECHAVESANNKLTNSEDYPKLEASFMDRTETAYQTLKNHSSIISWSIGNENGLVYNNPLEANDIFDKQIEYIRSKDMTRFIHAEFLFPMRTTRDGENMAVDVMSNMYKWPSDQDKWAVTPDKLKEDGTYDNGTNPKGIPYMQCEFSHAMGNACGSFDMYLDSMRSGTNMLGGYIWDWVDQSRRIPVTDGWDYYGDEALYGNLYKDELQGYYLGYGGDFGDRNNDGNYCVNGLISPDRQPQPELYEIKYQYQSFWMKDTPTYEQDRYTTDADLANETVVVYNENNFTDLNEYKMKWTLRENGVSVDSGIIEELPSVAPKTAGEVSVPFGNALRANELTGGAEYSLDIEILTKTATWALQEGHEVAHESFVLSDETVSAVSQKEPTEAEPVQVGGDDISVTDGDAKITVSGNGFSFDIDKSTGRLKNYVYNGETLITEGIRPNYWRAAHDNDIRGKVNTAWRTAYNDANQTVDTSLIQIKQAPDGRQVIDIPIELKVGTETAQLYVRYTADKSGAVTVGNILNTKDMSISRGYPLRIGNEIELSGDFENIEVYGNGFDTSDKPEYSYKYPTAESYSDRNSFAVSGVYADTVSGSYFPHVKAQETGTRTGVKWIKLSSDEKDTALLASAKTELEASALHMNTPELETGHPYQVSGDKNSTYLNLDYGSRGIGNETVGPPAFDEYTLPVGREYSYEYTLIPVSKDIDAKTAGVLSASWKAAAEPDVEIPFGKKFVTKELDLSTLDRYCLTGEKSGAQYREEAGTPENLYDGDTSTAIASAQKAVTLFDVSAYADKISKIEYSINSSASAGANFLYGYETLDDDKTAGSTTAYAAETIYRTNGTKADSITIESSTIDTEAGTGTAVLTGDFSKWNYIGAANGSAACGCSELTIYVEYEQAHTVKKTICANELTAVSSGSTISTKNGTISGHQLNYDGSENIYLYIPDINAARIENIAACFGFRSDDSNYTSTSPRMNFYAADSVLTSVSADDVKGKTAFAGTGVSKNSRYEFVWFDLDKDGAEFVTDDGFTAGQLKTDGTLSDPAFNIPDTDSNGIIVELIPNGAVDIYFDAFIIKYTEGDIIPEEPTEEYSKTYAVNDLVKTDGAEVTDFANNFSGKQVEYKTGETVYMYIPDVDCSKISSITAHYGFGSGSSDQTSIKPVISYYAVDETLTEVDESSIEGLEPFASAAACKSSQWGYFHYKISSGSALEMYELINNKPDNPEVTDISFDTNGVTGTGIVVKFDPKGSDDHYFDNFVIELADSSDDPDVPYETATPSPEEKYIYKTVNGKDISVKSSGSTISSKGGTISGSQLNYDENDGAEKIYLYIPGIDVSRLQSIYSCFGFNSGTSNYTDKAPQVNYYAADKTLSAVGEADVSGKKPFASLRLSKNSQWDFIYSKLGFDGAEFIGSEDGITVTLRTNGSISDAVFAPMTDTSEGIIIEVTPNGATNFYFDAFRFEYAYEASDKHDVTADNIEMPDHAYTGQQILIQLPEEYTDGSLVVTYNDGTAVVPVTLVPDEKDSTKYTFTMPAYDIYAGCIVNTDENKRVIVGTNDSYFARNDNAMKSIFKVPALDNAHKYTGADISIPVRAHANNAKNMTASINGAELSVDSGNISGSVAGDVIRTGLNTVTVTNENTSGVDYFHNSAKHYPETIEDLSVMTLTVGKVDLRIAAVTVDGERCEYDGILPSGGSLTELIAEKNGSAVIENGDVYAALYKDDMLIELRRTAVAAESFTDNEARLALSEPITIPELAETGYTMKVFIWDEDMRPMSDVFYAKTLKATPDDELEAGLMSMWYDEPAAEDDSICWTSFNADNTQADPSHTVWREKALPIGNGYMGAMIFGGVAQERIQLNEKTLWNGKPNHIEDDRSAVFEEARAKLLAGDPTAEETLSKLVGDDANYGSYTSFGNLSFDFTNIESGAQYTNYRRWLDLDNSIQAVQYDVDGITYTRKYFASYPDKLIAVKLSSNAQENVSFSMTFSNKPNRSKNMTTSFENNILKVTGELSSNDLRWCGEYKFINNGGEVSFADDTVTVSGADDVTVIMTMATDYEFDEDSGYRTGIDPADITAERIIAADGKTFEELYETHKADYKSIYDNVRLDIADDTNSVAVDDMRADYTAYYDSQENNAQKQITDEQNSENKRFDQLFYQYGRYMMISSSRAGSLPANLQGVWNDQEHPQWESDYHININLQMNYWPAANGNMIECMEPLLDWVEETAREGRQTAKNIYGCDGWVSHTCNNVWGYTAPGWDANPIRDIRWGMSPESSGWICLNLWDMYDYTRSTENLPRIYDIIQEAVRFYTQYLYYDETTGEYLAGPSYSAEQTDILTMGAKIDQQIIKQLYGIYLEASELDFDTSNVNEGKGKDTELIATVREQIDKLQEPVVIGEWGNIMEWNERKPAKYEEDSDHRHVSHLVSLYPCNQITRNTPDFLKAARTTLNARGDASTGWSRANKNLLWARAIGMDNDDSATEEGKNGKFYKPLGISNGDRAYSIYQGQVKDMVFDNMFDYHDIDIFQIDGNFGSCAAMGEYLMQSHAGYIDILPSLPTAWSDKGSVKGLLARGAFEVSIEWADAKPVNAEVKSNAGGECKVFINDEYGTPELTCGGEAVTYETETVTASDGSELRFMVFDTEAGKEYALNY